MQLVDIDLGAADPTEFQRLELEAIPELAEFKHADGCVCPDFEIHDPVGLDLSILSADAPADRFVLSLALAFNDLHSCGWVMTQIDRGEPKNGQPGSYLGLWMGHRLWISRVATAVVNETLVAIRKHSELLDTDDDLKATVDQLTEVGREAWGNVRALANGETGTKADQVFLSRVRHTLAYHYYDPGQLAKGFRVAFVDDRRVDPGVHNQALWVSPGLAAVQDLRFYFADAAAQCASRLIGEEVGKSEGPYREKLGYVAQAIGVFVLLYLQIRQKRILVEEARSRPRK